MVAAFLGGLFLGDWRFCLCDFFGWSGSRLFAAPAVDSECDSHDRKRQYETAGDPDPNVASRRRRLQGLRLALQAIAIFSLFPAAANEITFGKVLHRPIHWGVAPIYKTERRFMVRQIPCESKVQSCDGAHPFQDVRQVRP